MGGYFSREGYETAPYTVASKDDDYEIRDYPTMNIVETSGSFPQLFRFITGSNEQKQNISMTTPVYMQPKTRDGNQKMAFVMPATMTAEQVPKPTDHSLNVKQI